MVADRAVTGQAQAMMAIYSRRPDPDTALARSLWPLFLVQFACWCAMFLMWIGAYPVMTIAILKAAPADAAAVRRGMVMLATCFSGYSFAAACLAFWLPRAMARVSPPVLLGAGALIAASGLAGLGLIARPFGLVPCFTALAIGWCPVSNLPYTIAGRLLGSDDVEQGFRIFAFATILPQIAVTLALIFLIGDVDVAVARLIMLASGAMMALGGLLSLVLRRALWPGDTAG